MFDHRVFQFELVTGSIQSMSNGLGLVSAPFLISNVANNKNCLQRDLIHELHEAGIYDYAQSLGIIQNGVFVVQNGKLVYVLSCIICLCHIDFAMPELFLERSWYVCLFVFLLMCSEANLVYRTCFHCKRKSSLNLIKKRLIENVRLLRFHFCGLIISFMKCRCTSV